MDLLLTTTNDLDLTDNRIKLTSTSSELIRQRLQITFSINTGEWKFNTSFGLPWLTAGKDTQIIGKNEQSYVDAVLKNKILDEDGVQGVLSFTSSLDTSTRSYSFKAVVQLVDSTTIALFQEVFI